MADPKVVEALEELKRQLEHMRDIAKHHLEDAEQNLRAVTRTMDLLHTSGVLVENVHNVKSDKTEELVKELRTKKTQLAGLITIARKNDGRLRTKDARDLLQRAGLMKPTKNAANILYNVITRSERFTHVAPGEYILTEGSSIGSLPIN
jgi:hypothetical protein